MAGSFENPGGQEEERQFSAQALGGHHDALQRGDPGLVVLAVTGPHFLEPPEQEVPHQARAHAQADAPDEEHQYADVGQQTAHILQDGR